MSTPKRIYNYQFHDNVKLGKRVNSPITYEGAHLKLTAPFNGPPKFSLRERVTEVYDQGELGSCVAHSMAEGLKLVMTGTNQKLSWYQRAKPLFEPSRLYLYWNARVIDQDPLTEDSGCTNLSACLAVDEYKAVKEELWPYDVKKFNKPPPHDCFRQAHEHSTFEYSKVERSIDAIKHSLYQEHPVMAGFVVHESFRSAPKGKVPLPSGGSRDRILGGHSVLLIGYNDQEKEFEFQNHWTANWGDGGFGTVPYEMVLSEDLSGDFFSLHQFQ